MKPLDGLRLWITRPLPAALRSVAAWEEAGASARNVPTVELAPLPLSAPDWGRLRRAARNGRVVLTSANAATYLLEAVQDDAELAAAVLRLPVAAVGEATARAARELAFRVDVVSPRATGEDLAQHLSETTSPSEIAILPCSDRRSPEAEDVLQAAGWVVLPVPVYETRPVTSLEPVDLRVLADGGVDAVAFYSPSAVQGFLDAAGGTLAVAETRPAAFVLGPATGRAARDAGMKIAAHPDNPGESALIEAASTWWQQATRR